MSAALFIVVEHEVPGLGTFVNGKALGRSNHLEGLAQRAGVRPLMEFFSMSPEEAAQAIEELGGELPQDGLPAVQWFPAQEGLATVQGLLGQVTVDPQAIPDAEAVTSDLREFEIVLSQLAAQGIRWH